MKGSNLYTKFTVTNFIVLYKKLMIFSEGDATFWTDPAEYIPSLWKAYRERNVKWKRGRDISHYPCKKINITIPSLI